MSETPATLAALVAAYSGDSQGAVRFRPDTWDRKLATAPGATALLRSEAYTKPAVQGGAARAGDRCVGRSQILAAAADMDVADLASVLPVFVLTMAWGSGTSATRSLRNTASALADPQRAHTVLAAAAETLRNAEAEPGTLLRQAHRHFRLRGVGEAFFTKWFAFAGHVPDRCWQPLILDSRVRATLRKTLDVDLARATVERRAAARYATYVDLVHQWARDVSQKDLPADAARLEWILFRHNGAPATSR